MICLAIGLGILGFAAMRRARRCHGGGWGYRHHYGRRRWMLHHALSRIDASPAQERAIIGEIEKLEERLWGARRGLKDSREDLAAAIKGPVLDDAALGAVMGRVDAATGEVRSAVIDALRSIHGLLDDTQRAQVADMLVRQGGAFPRGGWRQGPYR
ncbi:MAG: periplasmic heavy metal sensor [Kofleriaceae bacterium]